MDSGKKFTISPVIIIFSKIFFLSPYNMEVAQKKSDQAVIDVDIFAVISYFYFILIANICAPRFEFEQKN